MTLKEKSGVVIIVDYSRDYTVVNVVYSIFFIFFSHDLRNYIFQSTKCEMTSVYMTSLHFDLDEAGECVDIMPLTLLASLSHFRELILNTKWRRYLA